MRHNNKKKATAQGVCHMFLNAVQSVRLAPESATDHFKVLDTFLACVNKDFTPCPLFVLFSDIYNRKHGVTIAEMLEIVNIAFFQNYKYYAIGCRNDTIRYEKSACAFF